MLNMSLRFDPESELTFNEDNSTVLRVFNENSQIKVCKIQPTAEDCYKINPSYFFLPSFQKVVVRIETNEDVDDDDYSDHEFIFNWLPIDGTGLSNDPENYWKQNLKSRRKEIVSKIFGCEFKDQRSQNVHNMEIITTSVSIATDMDRILQASKIDEYIERFGKMVMAGHTKVVELNPELDALIEKLEAAGNQQLNEIIETLREIAIGYKYLEHKTRSAVKQTANVVSEIARTAGLKKLKPCEKIKLMKKDFASLSNEFDALSKRHTHIGEQLATQADKAEALKEENDRRVKKAEKMKDDAIGCGLLAIPGLGFVSSVVACSYTAVDSVDNFALKVLAGVGGAIGGGAVGILVTAGSPILFTIAGVLAIKSKLWAVKFENIHDMIRQLETIMDEAAQHLSDIDSNLTALGEKINEVEPNENNRVLKVEFDKIRRTCEKVTEICNKYNELIDSKTKCVKQIDKPKSK